MKTPLLLLAHRIPYPPNKGDKVRSYHLLRRLARDYAVHLGAFVDDARDWRYAPTLQEWCTDVCLRPLHGRRGRIRGLTGLLTHEPLTVPYYRDRGLGRWVEDTLAGEDVRHIVVYSSAMAQYVRHHLGTEVRGLIDFVDVDSEKWREYATRRRWPMSWLYKREGRELLRFERAVAESFDASVFVTADEATLFRGLAPEVAERVHHVPNGVDTEYFSRDQVHEDPYGPVGPVLVFTGAMDYWPNVDAVRWFVREVFPRIQRVIEDVRFFVVGARPTAAVQGLTRQPGIHVTGTVPDIRPFLAHADVAVAPLRVARGLQNKVLEAMAMGRPVVATPAAMTGIEHEERLGGLVSDEPDTLAEIIVKVLRDEEASSLGEVGRALVSEHYSWSRSLDGYGRLLDARVPPGDVTGGESRTQPVEGTV